MHKIIALVLLLLLIPCARAQVRQEAAWKNLNIDSGEEPLIDMEYSIDGEHIIAAFYDSIRIYNVSKKKVERTFAFLCNRDMIFHESGRNVFYKHREHNLISFIHADTSYCTGDNKYGTEYTTIYSLITRDIITGKVEQHKILDTIVYVSYDKSFDCNNPSIQKTDYIFKKSNSGFVILWRNELIKFDADAQSLMHYKYPESIEDIALMDNTDVLLYENQELVLLQDSTVKTRIKIDSIDGIYSLYDSYFATTLDDVVKIYDFSKMDTPMHSLKLHRHITNIRAEPNGDIIYNYHNAGFNPIDGSSNYFLINNDFNIYGELIIEGGQSILCLKHPVHNTRLITTNSSLFTYELDYERDIPIFVNQLSHSSEINKICFSKDERYMASLSDDFVVIWDVRYAKVIQRYEVNLINDIQFANDGTYDLIYSNNSRLKWKNWVSNYVDHSHLSSPGLFSEFKPISLDKSLISWKTAQKGFEFPSYFNENSLASSDSYFIGKFRDQSTFKNTILFALRKQETKVLTCLPDDESIGVINFLNDSIVAIAGKYKIYLVNLPQQKIINVFEIEGKFQGKGVGMAGTSFVTYTDDRIIFAADDHIISSFDRKNGKLGGKFSIGERIFGFNKLVDIVEGNITYPKELNETFYQLIYPKGEGKGIALTLGEQDTVINYPTIAINFIKKEPSAISNAALIPKSSNIALLRIHYEENKDGKYDSQPYLFVHDYRNNTALWEISLNSDIEVPELKISQDGRFAAIWDLNECSNKYRRQNKYPLTSEDSDDFEDIMIVDLNTGKIKSISLSAIDISRISNNDVQFVPSNSNLLIIRDDYKSVVKYYDLIKKTVVHTVYGVEDKYRSDKYNNGDVQQPVVPSFTGDTLFFCSGNRVFHYIHNHLKGYSIHEDKLVVDYIDPNRITTASSVTPDGKIYLGHINEEITQLDLLKNERTGKFISTENGGLFLTADNFYSGDRDAAKNVFFRVNMELYPFSQFDLQFNRPDIVTSKLDTDNKLIIESYRFAYEKRLSRMGFSENMFSSDFHTPKIALINKNDLPKNTSQKILTLKAVASDQINEIDRLNIWINEVPIYGINGISFKTQNIHQLDTSLTILLGKGMNNIEISVINKKGVESIRDAVQINCIKESTKPDLYLIVLSVSEFEQSKFNLRYAVKDGRDIASLFATHNSDKWANVYIDTLFNEQVTIENINQLKNKLKKSNLDDEVIFYLSGHGVLDKNFDFYYAAHDMDFNDATKRGIPYDLIENILDSIPARKKLLLMDACHGGEVDKDELFATVDSSLVKKGNKNNGVIKYVYKRSSINDILKKQNQKIAFEIMQEAFINLDRRNGSTVIAASSGDSFAFEADEWMNGVFTYSLINGLKNLAADQNKNGEVSIDELKIYLSSEVNRLTEGEQTPSIRLENNALNYRVW